MKKFVCLLLGLCMCVAICAEVKCEEADSTLFVNYLRYVNGLGHAPSLSETGLFFLNTPYVAGVLDKDPTEPLVVNMRQLDCVTFVEHTLALTLLMKRQSQEWNDYIALLQQLRYRNGQCDGYASRLHYLSEWIQQAEANGYVEEKTCEWGGLKQAIHFHLLTDAVKKKQGEQSDSIAMSRLLHMEKNLSEQDYCYLPKDALSSHLNDGDIIAFCADGKGIDVWHVGIVLKQGNDSHLLHASSVSKKVIISSQTLREYMQHVNRYQGYRIIRLQ